MLSHPLLARIHEADRLIVLEDFDALMDHYAEDAVLVVKPGREVRGREAILEAMKKIASRFAHGLQVTQQQMQALEAGGTARVLARTVVSAPGRDDDLRDATYIYRREADGQWRCCIDNSYGHRSVDWRIRSLCCRNRPATGVEAARTHHGCGTHGRHRDPTVGFAQRTRHQNRAAGVPSAAK